MFLCLVPILYRCLRVNNDSSKFPSGKYPVKFYEFLDFQGAPSGLAPNP